MSIEDMTRFSSGLLFSKASMSPGFFSTLRNWLYVECVCMWGGCSVCVCVCVWIHQENWLSVLVIFWNCVDGGSSSASTPCWAHELEIWCIYIVLLHSKTSPPRLVVSLNQWNIKPCIKPPSPFYAVMPAPRARVLLVYPTLLTSFIALLSKPVLRIFFWQSASDSQYPQILAAAYCYCVYHS
jgi:hypothetical protein